MPKLSELNQQDIKVVSTPSNYKATTAKTQAPVAQKKSLFQGISDFVGATGLGKGAAQAIFFNFTPEGKNLLELRSQNKISQKEFDDVLDGGIVSNKQVVGSALQLAGNVALAGAPVGKAGTFSGKLLGQAAKSTAGRIGVAATQGAVAGSLASSGRALEQGQTGAEAISSGVRGAVTGAAFSGGITAIGELLQYAGSAFAKKSLEKSFGVSPKEVEFGKSPVQRFLKEGSGITKKGVLKNAQKVVQGTDEQIQAIIGATKNGSTRLTNSNIVLDQIKDDLTKKYAGALGPDDIDKLVDNLPINLLRKKSYPTIEEVNKLRSIIGSQYIGNSKWMRNADPEKISALKSAYFALADVVKAEDDRLPGLFAKLADNIVLRNSLNKELARKHALTLSLEIIGSAIYGGVSGGGFNGQSGLDALKAFAVLRTLQSAPVQIGAIRAGRAVNKLGPVIQTATKLGALNATK